jgi:ketosteroid isomerase-like protein
MADGAEIVQALYDAWGRGEFGAELFHPDVEWKIPHAGGWVRGRDELVGFLKSFLGAWSEYRNELEEVRALPDGRLLVLFTEQGRGRSSGVETSLSPGALVEIRDGMIYRYEGMERPDALRAAGLA